MCLTLSLKLNNTPHPNVTCQTSWFGFETPNEVPHGLWSVTREQVCCTHALLSACCCCGEDGCRSGPCNDPLNQPINKSHHTTPHARTQQIWTFLKENNFNTVRLPFSAALALQVRS